MFIVIHVYRITSCDFRCVDRYSNRTGYWSSVKILNALVYYSRAKVYRRVSEMKGNDVGYDLLKPTNTRVHCRMQN